MTLLSPFRFFVAFVSATLATQAATSMAMPQNSTQIAAESEGKNAAKTSPKVVDDSALWKKHVVYEGAQCMTAIAGDFTGDAKVDIVCNAGNTTRLLVAPDFHEVILDQSPDHNFIHSEAMDVDADGDLDYIGARYNPGLIVWLEQPAEPLEQKWPLRIISEELHGIHGLLQGDVDGDGQMELLATSAQPKPPHPNSLAWFSIPSAVKTASHWQANIFARNDAPGLTHYLGFGDVNGDGRPDAATGAKGGPQDQSGQGEWFAWWSAPANPRNPWIKQMIQDDQPGATNIHPADVNGDGIVDFIASRGHGQGVVWFEGPSWTERPIHESIQEPHCLTVGDWDHDGDIDAATCAFGDKMAAWFENDGSGTFVTHVIGRNQEAYDIRAIDIDGDADLDFLIAGRGSKNVVWYENPTHKVAPEIKR